MKLNATYPDGVNEVFHQLTYVEEYGGGFFSPNTFKEKRPVLCFPKSGNAWIQSLLLTAFGMLIPSYYQTDSVSSNPHLLNVSTCGCFMLQKDHDIGLAGNTESRIEFYNSEAIVLIRNPFISLIQTRYFNYRQEIGVTSNHNNGSRYVEKNLFIENKGNKQTINSFSIISSQLLLIDFS